MKTKLFILCLSLFVFFSAYADEDFTKKYSKEFSSNSSTLVEIKNKYGNVNITDWNQDKVSITVIITMEAHDQEEANERFEQIGITLEKSGDVVKGITEILKGFNNVDFSIDYDVKMPKDLKLVLENKYGSVFINELTNHVDIAVKYGSLKANKLTYGSDRPRSQISLGYCKNSKIEDAGWLKLMLAYSNLEVERSEALILLSKYSKFYADRTNSLVVESKYDTYRIGEVDKFVTTEAKYSNYDFRQINSKIETELKYSELNVDAIPASFSEIDIETKYGKVDLNIASDASYEIEGEARYGSIHHPSSRNLSTHKEHTSMKIWGRIGDKENPKAKVKIECAYGKVYLD